MLNDTVVFTTPQDPIADKIPADIYQITLTNVTESVGKDFSTGEPKQQLKFFGEVVEGTEKGKTVTFFTSLSWFSGGKSAKPSKLFNLVKNIYSFYGQIDVMNLPFVTAKDINILIGKQVRITVEETESGWPKVTAFTPIKKEIEYKSEVSDVEVNVDDIPEDLSN